MNRPIVYSLEQIRSFDILNGWRDGLYSVSWLTQNLIGKTEGVWQGFAASQSSPTSLVVQIAEGWIYQLAAVDATVYGSLASDTTQLLQQGYAAASTKTINTAGLSAGQSKWALIEIKFDQSDAIRTNDPNAGVLPYINTADPNNPFQGPNNSGVAQNTERLGVATITVKYGSAATSGSNVPPTVDAGYIPMYLINVAFGQTTITNGQILLAGPTAYAGYAVAPVFPGVTGAVPGSSGSHHGAIAGQANKILLTSGAEVTGLMDFGNLPVSNTSPPTVGGIVTAAGEIPILTLVNTTPSGNLAGNRQDMAFYPTQNLMFVCTVSGTAGTATWNQVGVANIAIYVAPGSFPLTVATGGFIYLCDSSSGNVVVNLLAASAMAGSTVTLVNIGTNTVTINPLAGESINYQANGVAMTLTGQGDSIKLAPRTAVGYYVTQ